MSIEIRLLKESEVSEADGVLRSAFARTLSFEPVLRLHLEIEPDGFWVATDHGKILGTVGCVNYGQCAYIGMMSVDPSAQSRGLGRRLMNHLLNWLALRGDPVALLDATDRGALLYKQLGFVDDSTAYVYERASSAPLSAARHLHSLAGDNDLAAIIRFDAPLFGADRTKLLERVWTKNRQRCLIARNSSGKLDGYLFAGEPILGPWAAVNVNVALELLTAATQLPFKHAPVVLVPRSNHLALELLERCGFVQRRTLRHMRRGGSSPPGQPLRLFGQSSFAHG